MKKESSSIRKKLMDDLKLTKEEADYLIKVYAKNHEGNVNISEIKDNMKKLTNALVFKVGDIPGNVDVGFELSCGKDRKYDMVMGILGNNSENKEIANEYLNDYYADTVQRWVNILGTLAENKIQNVLDSGIEKYREFVNRLPYKNIGRVAETYCMEEKIARFLALNGNEDDFRTFINDIRPNIDKSKTIRKVYPSKVSNKIFDILRKEVSEDRFSNFTKRLMMPVISLINKNEDLSEGKKKNIEETYIRRHMQKKINDHEVGKLLKNKHFSKYDILSKYFSKESYEERKEFIEGIYGKEYQKDIQVAYYEFMKIIEEKKDLTQDEFIELFRNSKIINNGKNSAYMSANEDEVILSVIEENPFLDIDASAKIDASKMKEIIDRLNDKEKFKVEEKLEEYSQEGIGNVRIVNNYETERRFRDSEERVLGALSDEENSPYIIGGKRQGDELTNLVMKIPCKNINQFIGISYENMQMNEDQVRRFNNLDKEVKFKEHRYTYGRVDGYYSRQVLDFEVLGRQMHIKNDDWTNGGTYTVVWEGEEKDYPEKAIGLTSSTSEWARNQRKVDKEFIIKFINSNPNRFIKLLEKEAGISNCCGLFPTTYIEYFCKQIMELPTEKELYMEDFEKKYERVLSILKKVYEESCLKEKEKKAEELLKEYEEQKGNTKKIEEK